MEFWFIIVFSILVVIAITLLLYFELMGDSSLRLIKTKKKNAEYTNRQSAMICHSIMETVDSQKAYILFGEYIFTNYKLFLLYVKNTFYKISSSYYANDVPALEAAKTLVKEMKQELKFQKFSQEKCLSSIDSVSTIESIAWISLANSCLFEVNDNLNKLADVCIFYLKRYSNPFPEMYAEQLDVLATDICNISNEICELIGSNDIEKMRELRKDMKVILKESYSNSQRLYALLHDGRSDIEPEKKVALQFALNAFQESHCMLYTLRRFLLALICITISVSPSNS